MLRTQHLLLYAQRPAKQGSSLGEPSLRNSKCVCADRGMAKCQRGDLVGQRWEPYAVVACVDHAISCTGSPRARLLKSRPMLAVAVLYAWRRAVKVVQTLYHGMKYERCHIFLQLSELKKKHREAFSLRVYYITVPEQATNKNVGSASRQTPLRKRIVTWTIINAAVLLSDMATSGCSGPSTFSRMANDRP